MSDGSASSDDPARRAAVEPVEIVDPDGRVISVVARAEMRAGRLRHRTVFVAVLGSDDRLLVHQRAPWKDTAAGWWDLAFGGVMAPGEDWADAARRELAEEAGVTGVDLEPLGRGTYEDDAVAEVAEVFLARTDGPFACDDGEVVALDWLAAADLEAWRAARPVCPDTVALVLPRLPWGRGAPSA